MEGALQYGHTVAGLRAGEAPGVAPAYRDGFVGCRVTFVGYLDVFPVERN